MVKTDEGQSAVNIHMIICHRLSPAQLLQKHMVKKRKNGEEETKKMSVWDNVSLA